MIATLPSGKNASSKSSSVDSDTVRQDALQHEYISQLLVEHNFLPLSLKLLGQQDAVALCRAQNEIDAYCFMSHCTRRVKIKPTVSLEPPLPTDGSQCRACWRNCFTVMNFLRILQSLAKRRAHRIMLMLQYKAPAVLKRVLKVQHPLIQRYAYKVCKTFVPYAGRKWRCTVANMRVITGVYLHCRQDLRDDWLIGGEQEMENDEAVVGCMASGAEWTAHAHNQEHALRTLANYYNEHAFTASAASHGPTSTDATDIDALIASFDEELWLEDEDTLLFESPEQQASYEAWLNDMLAMDEQDASSPLDMASALNAMLFPASTCKSTALDDTLPMDGGERAPTPAPRFH
ncbi:hypothetical protein SYNPS1DRAFT_29439 [Syncephalis pseudoplumigaleata]|uniref:Far11/STRP C-terminal domain-containing protein n=1 Tax=Syncephalis pseudoplumigaleata TaxID=1712513 RepID=A0A4P9Z0E3_9FUNG|nr:hypothetical protein SYNPS1DRAFT_29439 [Syncephalis pseudoplumigaleata]|eukprot:RKP24810.1 hypothetical protein SYNPS1DRAFT_29439 [Syncephalis pseudoplumigaleata]